MYRSCTVLTKRQRPLFPYEGSTGQIKYSDHLTQTVNAVLWEVGFNPMNRASTGLSENAPLFSDAKVGNMLSRVSHVSESS
jgi:hypothetical protein